MRKLLVVAALLSALSLSACSTAADAPIPSRSATPIGVEVPSVVGLSGMDAANALHDAGLQSDPQWNGGNTVDDDTFDVLAQAPAGGETVDPNSTVVLEVGAPPLPNYQVAFANESLYEVTVDRTLELREAHWIVRELLETYPPEGGYFVNINCSVGGAVSSDNRQANGKFAVGTRGGALTGLKPGTQETEMVVGAACP